MSTGTPKDALFTLSALPEQWQEFFRETPVAPYQSYWGIKRQSRRLWEEHADEYAGMFGMNIKQEGIRRQSTMACDKERC